MRTSGGAAMSSTITDCRTRMMSMGVCVTDCMTKPPALSAPKSRPDQNTPHARERPSSATVMASKPSEPAMPPVRNCSVPCTCAEPARPASRPATVMATTVTAPTFMPAVRAAAWLAPTARRRKPRVERSSSHHTTTVATTASRKAALRRKPSPSSEGHREFSARRGDLGWLEPSSWKAEVVSR